MRANVDRIVFVVKPTRLEELVTEHQTLGTTEFVLRSKGDSINRYRAEYKQYTDALRLIRQSLPLDLDTVVVVRANLASFLFRESDLVIVCGPDGLFVNLAQFIGKQPVIGVNPNPGTVAGPLMPFFPYEVKPLVRSIREGSEFLCEELPFVRATVDRRQELWGINDIFAGRLDHISALYSIAWAGKSERHSSSGVIVSTAVGATGWLRSIAAMAAGLVGSRNIGEIASPPTPTDRKLRFVVREPFPSPETKTEIVTGVIAPGEVLRLTSEMPQGGVLFSDGNVANPVEWSAGSVVEFALGERTATLVVPSLVETRRNRQAYIP